MSASEHIYQHCSAWEYHKGNIDYLPHVSSKLNPRHLQHYSVLWWLGCFEFRCSFTTSQSFFLELCSLQHCSGYSYWNGLQSDMRQTQLNSQNLHHGSSTIWYCSTHVGILPQLKEEFEMKHSGYFNRLLHEFCQYNLLTNYIWPLHSKLQANQHFLLLHFLNSLEIIGWHPGHYLEVYKKVFHCWNYWSWLCS